MDAIFIMVIIIIPPDQQYSSARFSVGYIVQVHPLAFFFLWLTECFNLEEQNSIFSCLIICQIWWIFCLQDVFLTCKHDFNHYFIHLLFHAVSPLNTLFYTFCHLEAWPETERLGKYSGWNYSFYCLIEYWIVELFMSFSWN